jgi:hypothetical protein
VEKNPPKEKLVNGWVGVKQIFIFSENHSAEAMISTDQQTIE